MNLEAELAKLDALETVEDSQYQFQTPFRAILFGTLVRENIIFFRKPTFKNVVVVVVVVVIPSLSFDFSLFLKVPRVPVKRIGSRKC